MTNERHPSHDWFEVEEPAGNVYFCDNCQICSCHSPLKSAAECSGEIDDPEGEDA